MLKDKLAKLKDNIHAQLCYQLFITPLYFPIDGHYRHVVKRAHKLFTEKRNAVIERHTPRHHVIHHFAAPQHTKTKKILITHGWMSRAACMARLIRALTTLSKLHFRHYTKQAKTPFLYIHGEQDSSVKPIESSIFCQQYPYATCSLIPGANHISVLMDERVEKLICQFLCEETDVVASASNV